MEPVLGILAVLLLVGSAHPAGASTRPGTYISLATFNTGLTPRVEEYAARREQIGDTLSGLPAGVVCLQEVWYSYDMIQIINSTAINHKYPYTFSALHDDVAHMTSISSTEAPCRTHSFASTFMPCMLKKCSGTSGMGVLTCARLNCRLMALGQACITCLMLSDPSNAAHSCYQQQGSRINEPGLLLLSNLPLTNVRVERYVADVNVLLPRAYISAEVEGLGTVICTHTTANLGPDYFEALSQYHSWAEQNLDEARALVSTLEHVQHVVVMGDLNSSPAVPSTEVSADLEGGFQYFRSHGYQSPYTDWLGICTWCSYNSIAHAQHNLILDHILLKNLTAVHVSRIIDEEDQPLSDHFGIRVVVESVN